MGTIKIGEPELLVISRIEQMKENHKIQLDGALRALSLIENQIPDSEDKAFYEIQTRGKETIKRVENLNRVIQEIEFSKEHDEDKFFVAWLEFIDKTGACFKYGFGKSISKEPVSEKQFVFALASWEREVCKRLALLKEFERTSYDSLCPTLELDIRKMLYEYVLKN